MGCIYFLYTGALPSCALSMEWSEDHTFSDRAKRKPTGSIKVLGSHPGVRSQGEYVLWVTDHSESCSLGCVHMCMCVWVTGPGSPRLRLDTCQCPPRHTLYLRLCPTRLCPSKAAWRGHSQSLSACDAEVSFLLGSQGNKWETSAHGFLTVEDAGFQKPWDMIRYGWRNLARIGKLSSSL